METPNRTTKDISRQCSTTNYKQMGNELQARIIEYTEQWEKRCYKEGIPDDAPMELGDKVPSYKRICMAILKNDFQLVGLGYAPKVTKYYSILKRIEIDARIYEGKQLRLLL